MKCFSATWLRFWLVGILTSGCGNGEPGSIAVDAGADQAAPEGTSVTLEGTGSGSAFSWAQLSGPKVTLEGADQAVVRFEAPWIVEESANIELELTVNEGSASATDTVTVTVTNTHFVLFLAAAEQGRRPELYRAPLDGSSEPIKLSRTPVANGTLSDEYLASLDGRYVAYHGAIERPLVDELFVVPSEGGESTKVSVVPPDAEGSTGAMSWSPDGARIAYSQTVDHREIYTNTPDGTQNAKINGTLTEGANAGSPAWSPDSGRIAYRAAQDTQYVRELYTSKPDGSDNVKVHPGLGEFEAVASFQWSPDGSRIAYRYGRVPDQRYELFAAAPDGSSNVRLNGPLIEGGTVESGAAWSPDGTRIAYRADQQTDNVFELFTSAANGSGNVRVNAPLAAGAGAGGFGSYSWSPDGGRIAYVARHEGDATAQLYTAAPDGSGNVRVNAPLDSETFISSGTWSPDGRLLAYTVRPEAEDVNTLVTSTEDGREHATVNEPLGAGGSLQSFAWSPDGSRIAYLAYRQATDAWELFSAKPDGSDHAKVNGPLGEGGDVEFDYRWSPGSSRIVYRARQDGESVIELYSSKPDGSDSLKIAGGGGVDSFSVE